MGLDDDALYRDPAQPVESRVADLLGRMTLAEKIEQMHGVQREPIDHLYQTPANARLGIPGFRMVDGPRGVRAGKATAFPVGMPRGASFDPQLQQRVGEAIGAEIRAKGGNVRRAGVNVLRRATRAGDAPSFTARIHTTSASWAPRSSGAQRHVVASVKHYAANSIENNRFMVSANPL